MKSISRRVAVSLALAACAAPALAQSDSGAGKWPSRTIHLIVPFPPGATADAFARAIEPKLAQALGQPVVVENRSGANGVIGSLQVAKAKPDGHTLLLTFATHYSLPFIQKAVPFDVVKDFTPIIAAAKITTVLAVHPRHPAKNMSEFLAHARASSAGSLYGSGGLVMFGELLAQAADIKMVHVPYKGGGLMMTDLLGGQIDTGLTVLSSALPQVQQGKLRVLAVLSDKRSPVAPEIPAITESVPGFTPQDTWVGILGPAGLPKPIVERVHDEVKKIIETPALRARFAEIGFEVTGDLTPTQLSDEVKTRHEAYRRVTEKAGIQPE